MSKILIDALEEIKIDNYTTSVFTPLTDKDWVTIRKILNENGFSLDALSAAYGRIYHRSHRRIALKALSDYASQKETVKPPSEIFFKHLDKQRKKGDALLFKHIEPVIYAAMEEYAAQFQFTSPAPESGQKEGIKKDINRLEYLMHSHIMPYNLGDTGEIATIISRLHKKLHTPPAQTIPASAFLIIANAVAEKLQKEATPPTRPAKGGEEKKDTFNYGYSEQKQDEFYQETQRLKQEIERLKGLIEQMFESEYEARKKPNSLFKEAWQTFAKENGLTDK